MFGGTIVQTNFMQLSAHSRKSFNNQKFSFEKPLFIRPLRLFFSDHMKLTFDKEIKDSPSALLSYISTRRFSRKREPVEQR